MEKLINGFIYWPDLIHEFTALRRKKPDPPTKDPREKAFFPPLMERLGSTNCSLHTELGLDAFTCSADFFFFLFFFSLTFPLELGIMGET